MSIRAAVTGATDYTHGGVAGKEKGAVEVFREAQDVFVDAAVALGRAWDGLHGPQVATDFGADKYPFAKSFDEMIADVIEWKHATIVARRAPRAVDQGSARALEQLQRLGQALPCRHPRTFESTVCPTGTVCSDCGRMLSATCRHDQAGDHPAPVEPGHRCDSVTTADGHGAYCRTCGATLA